MMVIEQLLEHMMEGFLMAGAGLSIFGIKLEYKKLISIGIVYGIIIYIVRWFYIRNKIPLGTHSIILGVMLVLIIRYLGNQNYLMSILATLMSYIFLIWGEMTVSIPIMKLFIKNPKIIGAKLGHYIVGGALTCTFLMVLFVVCYIFNITIIDLSDLDNTEKNRG